MSKLLTSIIAAAALSFTNLASAAVIQHDTGSHTWAFGQGGASYSDFDRAEFLFDAEFVDTITISNAGWGYAHIHSGGEEMIVSVLNGSNWVNVFSAPTDWASYLKDVFANPITFSGMTISGLRLDSNMPVGYHYHGVEAGMTYALSGTPSDVPEPASIALFGIAAASALAARRRQNKSK